MATKKSLPGTDEQPGTKGKMNMERAKRTDSDKLGKKGKGGGGFKNKAMEHKR
jgi:hypothetical protein